MTTPEALAEAKKILQEHYQKWIGPGWTWESLNPVAHRDRLELAESIAAHLAETDG